MRSFRTRHIAFRVSVIYALVTGSWILFSDRLLYWMVQDAQRLTRLQTAKGWFFVMASATLIAWLVHHYVTLLRAEERKLRQTNSLLENVLANIPHYIFWKDRQGRYLGCNQRFAAVAGVGDRKNIVGKTDHDLAWRPQEDKIFLQHDQQVIEKRRSFHDLEQTVRQADGGEATFLISKAPLEDDEGGVIGLMGIFRDITLHKREEKARRESERRLATLMGNLPGMAYRCRNDRKWTMEFVSEGCRNLTGYSPDELVGNRKLSFAEIIPSEARKEIWQTVQSALAAKNPFHLEYGIRTASGAERWVWEQGEGIFEKGEVVALEGFITDITDRKRAEDALRESDRLKSDFVATAAHEFRTPLTSIMGFSDVLLTQKEISDEERHEFLTYIRERSKRLSKIVADMLDIARIEAGEGIPLERSPWPVKDMVESIRPFLQAQPSTHRIETNLNSAETVIDVDREKMEQVMENLLSNALKYSPADSLIQIRGEPVSAGYRIAVVDQGVGMTPDQVARVFDKFYRAETSHTAAGGIGLGMFTVKSIIEAHGGEIRVESRPGRGTTVSITLPLAG